MALLLVPSLALAVWAGLLPSLTQSVGPTLTLSLVRAKTVPRRQRNDADVEVEAGVVYHQSFIDRHFWHNQNLAVTNACIVDGKGRRHTTMTWAPGATKSLSFNNLSIGLGEGSVTFPLWLRYIPKLAGPLTFKFNFVAADGYTLPISIRLRS